MKSKKQCEKREWILHDYKAGEGQSQLQVHFYKSLWVEFPPKKVCLFVVPHQPFGADSIYKVLDETGLCAISQDVQRGDRSWGKIGKVPVPEIVLLWAWTLTVWVLVFRVSISCGMLHLEMKSLGSWCHHQEGVPRGSSSLLIICWIPGTVLSPWHIYLI